MSLVPLLALGLLTACPGGKEEPKEIVIGEYGSLTGAEATFGLSTKEGIELATEEENDIKNNGGGIAGTQIRLVVEDDQSKSEEASLAVSKILSRDRPVAVLGEVVSTRSLAAAPLLQRASVPMISPSSTNEEVTRVGDYIFRVCFIDPFQGTAIAKFAFEDKKLRKVAMLVDVKSDYSVGLAKSFTASFLAMGGEIVGEEAYNGTDFDFKAQLTNLIAKGPEAMILPANYGSVGMIAKQARELGFQGLFLGGDGWDSTKLVEIGKDAIVGGYYTNHYSVDDPAPVVQDFIKKYEAKYHAKPDGLAALGYDAAKILYMAMEDVAKDPKMAAAFADRSSTPAGEPARLAARVALRDRLATVKDYPGVTGNITIDKDRNAQKPAVVVEVTKDGSKFAAKISPGAAEPVVPPVDPTAPIDPAAPPAPIDPAAPATPASAPAP